MMRWERATSYFRTLAEPTTIALTSLYQADTLPDILLFRSLTVRKTVMGLYRVFRARMKLIHRAD